jgi:hypothetical protein
VFVFVQSDIIENVRSIATRAMRFYNTPELNLCYQSFVKRGRRRKCVALALLNLLTQRAAHENGSTNEEIKTKKCEKLFFDQKIRKKIQKFEGKNF